MLELKAEEITLGCNAHDRDEALGQIVACLKDRGLVDGEYLQGMREREQQASTYLGQGIAIPHGTLATRHAVKATGIHMMQFPDGVDWGDGQIVYLAIGIAAQSDEHLGILKGLTRLLDRDNLAEQIRVCQSNKELLAQLSVSRTPIEPFVADCVHLDVRALQPLDLLMHGASEMLRRGWIERCCVADFLETEPFRLGQMVLVTSTQGVLHAGMQWVSAEQPLTDGLKGMLLIASDGQSHLEALRSLAHLHMMGQLNRLLSIDDPQSIVAILNPEIQGGGLSEEFTIINPHGLHARPGAVLVNLAKSYPATLWVEKMDEQGDKVNAKSLMKVLSLGVTQGDRLRFTAEGESAQEALCAIGDVIAAGLGEE